MPSNPRLSEGGCGSAPTAEAAMPSHEQIAIKVARRCREIIQTCLREEEWADAEEEFRRLILAGLQEAGPKCSVCKA